MKTFKDLEFHFMDHTNGIQAIEFFENGYGISCVKHDFSYGGKKGLYEIAVIKGNPKNWIITYDTPITDDVLGYLTKEDVSNVMEQVANLKE